MPNRRANVESGDPNVSPQRGPRPSQAGRGGRPDARRRGVDGRGQGRPAGRPAGARPSEGANGKPRRSAGGGPSRPSRAEQARQQPQYDDNVSDVSDGNKDEAYDVEDEPRFKYSTAALADNSARNSRCCIGAAIIFFIIVAIAISIVMLRTFNDKDEGNKAPPPTLSPTFLNGTSDPGVNQFLESKHEVDSKCSSDNWRNNPDLCRDICDGFDCCEPSLPSSESCFTNNKEGCLSYQRCHVTTPSGIDVPPINLETICSLNRIASDRETCEDACDSVRCCWKSDAVCVDKFYSCMDYAPCQNLREEVTVPAALDSIHQYCDSSNTGSVTQNEACDNRCKPAECCWSEGDDNCLQSEFFSCLTYSPCGKLDMAGAGLTVSLPPTDIGSKCSITKILTGDTAGCESACSAGECCAEDTDNNCFLDDPMACIQYEPCDRLEE